MRTHILRASRGRSALAWIAAPAIVAVAVAVFAMAAAAGAAGHDPRGPVGPRIAPRAASTCSPDSYPPGTTFSYGVWPPSCWRPYSDLSAFNLPVPATVPAATPVNCGPAGAAGSCPESGYRLPGAGDLLFDPNGWTGWPTYYVQSSDNPVDHPILCTGDNGNGACDHLQSLDSPGIPIPAGQAPAIQFGRALAATQPPSTQCVEGNMATDPPADCHITIVDTSTHIEHDLFATHTTDGTLRPFSDQGQQVVEAGGSGHLDITGNGQDAGPGNAVAAGVGTLAGRIRLEEFEDAVAFENGQGGRPIGHALAITVPCLSAAAAGGLDRYPATAPDGGGARCADPAPLMGTRFQLHPTAAQFAALEPWQRAIVRAATTYGLIVMDIATGSNHVSLEFESGNQYSAAGQTVSPWFTYAHQTLGWQVGGPPCSGWTGLLDPSDSTDTRGCPAVGGMGTPAMQAVWGTASVVPECGSYPASSSSACPQVRTAPVLTTSNATPTAGDTITVSGSGYPPLAPMTVCEAPTPTQGRCPAGAPSTPVQTAVDGSFTGQLQVTSAVAGTDCTRSAACKVFVPDRIWDRPTGRAEASAPIVVSGTGTGTAPRFTAASPPAVAEAGRLYSYRFAASGTPNPAFSLQPPSPPWLHIDPNTGRLTGTPPAGSAGQSVRYTVTATNSSGHATAGPFIVRVLPLVGICYRAHVQNLGWMGVHCDGAVAGTVGRALRLEALQIFPRGTRRLCAQAHVQNLGWMPVRCAAAGGRLTVGTTGRSLRLEALRLFAGIAGRVCADAHLQDIGWQGWRCGHSVMVGTTGQSRRMEAIEIRLTRSLIVARPGHRRRRSPAR